MLPALRRKEDRTWRETVEDNVVDWWEVLRRQSFVDAEPVNPMRIMWELSPRLPEDAIVTADSGSAARSIGLEGIDVDDPADLGPAWDRALTASRPVVLDVRC